MIKAENKDFKSPDEVRTFEKGKMEILNIGDSVVGLAKFEPGWRWSLHVKPIAKTELCEVSHFFYQLSGRLHIVMENGEEFETLPGQVSFLPPGHDAWVIGEEPVVVVDWSGAKNYAKE